MKFLFWSSQVAFQKRKDIVEISGIINKYLVFAPVLGTELLNPRNPEWQCLWYANKITPGCLRGRMRVEVASGWEPVARKTNQMIRRLEHPTPLPTSKRRELRIEFSPQWSMIQTLILRNETLIKTSKQQQGLVSLQIGECVDGWQTQRGHGSSMLLSLIPHLGCS